MLPGPDIDAIVQQFIEDHSEIRNLYREQLVDDPILRRNFRDLVKTLESSVKVFDKKIFHRALTSLENLVTDETILISKQKIVEQIEKVREASDLDRKDLLRQELRMLRIVFGNAISRGKQNDDSDEREDRREALDSFLFNLFYISYKYSPSESEFTEILNEATETYVKCRWMWKPLLSKMVIERHLWAATWSYGKILRWPAVRSWKIVATIITFGILQLIWSFSFYETPIAVIWFIVYPAFIYYRAKSKMAVMYPIVIEVESGSFDEGTISSRLRRAEEKGVTIHSLVYKLLES